MIEKFRGQYGFLSNMHPCDIEYNGRHFHSSEGAYMSRKNNSKSWVDLCSNTQSGVIIKKASHYITLLKDWDEIKLGVMEDVLRIKFQIPELKMLLLETGDLHIQEGNTWNDTFWGVDLKTGEGQNNLGILLMKIRKELSDAQN